MSLRTPNESANYFPLLLRLFELYNVGVGNFEQRFDLPFNLLLSFRLSLYSGSFIMDIVTRQFINLTKKLRKELRHALQQQTDAIRQSTKAARDNKQQPLPMPLPVVAELQLPETEKTQRRTEYRESRTLQIWLTVGTWLAFLAASIYAGITYYQLKTANEALNDNRKSGAEQLSKLGEQVAQLKTANQIAVDAERPWIGINFTVRELDASTLQSTVWYANSGRRPAKLIASYFYWHVYKSLPDSPLYVPLKTDIRGQGIIVPNSNMTNSQSFSKITEQASKELVRNGEHVFIYAKMEYEDVSTHQRHWVHGCIEYFPGFQNAANGWVNCSTYNDTGDGPPPDH